MSVEIDKELIEKAASQISTQDDLADFSRQLLKLAIERVLSAELEEHLRIHSGETPSVRSLRQGIPLFTPEKAQ